MSTSTTPVAWRSSPPCGARAGHDIVEHALTALRNLDHRGATGADPATGDGAGILTQMPDRFLRESAGLRPARARRATRSGWPSCPTDAERAPRLAARIEDDRRRGGAARPGLARRTRVPPTWSAQAARDCMPPFRQLVRRRAGPSVNGIGAGPARVLPAQAGRARARRVYFASLSARTLVYKGMLTTEQLEPFFPDLSDPPFETELALVHSRFSTNTFPSWPLAHPYRLIAHNGEINTVKGNRNWMRARESQLASDLIPGDLTGCSRSARRRPATRRRFDEVLELLHLGGPLAAARRADDDPRGVGEPRRDGPRAAGVLRVPRDVHGAVGRAGLRRVHRRHA